MHQMNFSETTSSPDDRGPLLSCGRREGGMHGRSGPLSLALGWVALAAVFFAAAFAGSTTAGPMGSYIIPGNLYPTGFDNNTGSTPGNVAANTRDGQWKVAAYAAGGTFQPGYTPSSTPYDAYVFQSSVSGSLGIPPEWLGGNANDGYCGAMWIGLQNSPFGIINGPTSTSPTDFRSSMVLSTNFDGGTGGVAYFDFWASSDNSVAFFVGGTITTTTNVVDSGTVFPAGWQAAATGSNFPTIADGQQIGFGRSFSRFTHYTGTAWVNPGSDNTLYAVVYDQVSGPANWTGFLFSPVPEPSTIVMAGIACGCVAYSQFRKRRPRQQQAAADRPADAGA